MEDHDLSTSDLAATESGEETDDRRATPPRDAPLARAHGDQAEHVADEVSPDARTGGTSGMPATSSSGETRASVEAAAEPLLPPEQSERFTGRWQEIQTGFVDEPRRSVEQADALVADLMQRLAAGFADERQRLEGQWDRGDDVSTEDLRIALTRYRSFFDRLLSA